MAVDGFADERADDDAGAARKLHRHARRDGEEHSGRPAERGGDCVYNEPS